MYKIIAATAKISQKERKKMRKWVTFDGKADVKEIGTFERLEEAKKAFKNIAENSPVLVREMNRLFSSF